MTKSEQLLSAFSEDYFYKELVLDDLHFTPEGSSKIELADLIINLGDIILAIQLKERNDENQTNDPVSENNWFKDRCKEAKKQVKRSLELISSGTLPAFQNKRVAQCVAQWTVLCVEPIAHRTVPCVSVDGSLC